MGTGLSGALLRLREELDAVGISQFEMVLAGSHYAVRRAGGVCARELGVGPQSTGGAFSCYGVRVVECFGALPPGGVLRGEPLSPGRGAGAAGGVPLGPGRVCRVPESERGFAPPGKLLLGWGRPQVAELPGFDGWLVRYRWY